VVSRARRGGVPVGGLGGPGGAGWGAPRGIDWGAPPPRGGPGPEGAPVPDDTLAWLLCRVVDRVVVGDHAVVLAEPELLRHADVGSPLLYHRGRYADLADTTDPGDRRCAA